MPGKVRRLGWWNFGKRREEDHRQNHGTVLGKTGDDMENIRMELEKLISYTLGRDVITDQDVEGDLYGTCDQ